MHGRARLFFLIAGAMGIPFLAGSASANTATLRCNAQRDQIWVYDSLSSFNVEAKLKCGDGVEIIGRVKDYVRIRVQNGVEGYVPEAAFSDLPAAEIYRDPTRDVGTVAKQVQAKEIAKVAANASSLAPADLTYSAISPAAAAPVKKPGTQKTAASVSIAPFTALAEANPASAPAMVAAKSSAAANTPATQPPARAPKAPEHDITAPATRPPVSIASPAPVTSSAIATVPKIASLPSHSVTAATDSSEVPDLKPESESADLACQSYFSAYGLTPAQTKWIAQNREKVFSTICPAPDPSKVDFVIIFTHDVDFFDATMPQPVHSSNGFSDFTPMVTIDTALVPESQADKARREYVWIFQFAKGTFDPAAFSPHRQYQFSKMETNSLGTKAGLKTVEDAFRFAASANR